jgi:hypothetical protein
MAHRVKLRRTEVETRLLGLGLTAKTDQARAIGVGHSIHHRALTGERPPNAAYVLGVLMLVGSPDVREEIAALFERESAA